MSFTVSVLVGLSFRENKRGRYWYRHEDGRDDPLPNEK